MKVFGNRMDVKLANKQALKSQKSPIKVFIEL